MYVEKLNEIFSSFSDFMTYKKLELPNEYLDEIGCKSFHAMLKNKGARGFFFGKRRGDTIKVEKVLHLTYEPRVDKNILYKTIMWEFLLLDDFFRIIYFLLKTKYNIFDTVGTYHSHPSGESKFSPIDIKTIRNSGEMVHFLYVSPSDYTCVNNLLENVEVVIL